MTTMVGLVAVPETAGVQEKEDWWRFLRRRPQIGAHNDIGDPVSNNVAMTLRACACVCRAYWGL
jgi:hypothetical protein